MSDARERPLISVIVPLYNVEKYLPKCLDSLLAQTWRNMEVLLIDDASTDGGASVCDAYAARDGRLRVLRQGTNRGPSAARNVGIREAGGDFITFVDADDYVESDYLEKLHRNLTETQADISVCGSDDRYLRGGASAVFSAEETVYPMLRRIFLWSTCGKLYPAELVKKHAFDERVFCGEDLLFFYQMLKETRTVSYFPDRLYHYVCRSGSLVNSGVNEKRCMALPVIDQVCEDADTAFPSMADGFRCLALDMNARLAMQAVEEGVTKGRLTDYLRRFQKNVRKHISPAVLRLCPDAKSLAAALALGGSVPVFYGFASVYRVVKRWTRKENGL